MAKKKNGEHDEPTLRITLSDDVCEVMIEGEIVIIPVSGRTFQITFDDKVYFHKDEDAEGRWVYRSARE